MRKVTILVSPLHKTQFSGGLIAVFRYAEGLQHLGWDVSIVPIGPSPTNGWFDRFGKLKVITLSSSDLFKDFASSLLPLCVGTLKLLVSRSSERKKSLMLHINATASVLLNIFHRFLPYEAKRFIWVFNTKKLVDSQDIIIATTYETAYSLQTAGIKDYLWFMMHDERLFVADFKGHKSAAELDVDIAARRSKHVIVNSSWLKERILTEFPDKNAWLCLNALEDEFKVGAERRRGDLKTVNILSYSGRGASWKGFAEMREGVRLARSRRPDIRFNWRVYGPLPTLEGEKTSDDYANLGFISDSELISEYLRADVLLSASWYESFPLFPLEGMGLGAAVIATMLGCEDYLKHELNGLVVPPRNPIEICDALIRLADDEELRLSIIDAGFKTARAFDWSSSCANLQRILYEFDSIRRTSAES